MSTEAQVQTLVPTKAELEEWDAAVEQAVESLKGKKVEAANMAAAAVQFMAVSHEDLDRVSNQGIVSRVIGFFTGRNAKLRERSQRNMLHAQKASLQLVRRLAEQNALQMDAMVALANLVNYLHFKEVETKKALLELFDGHEKRLRDLEGRVDALEKVHGWAFKVKARPYVRLPNASLRLLELVNDAHGLGLVEWRTGDLEMFEAATIDARFECGETITIRNFLHDLARDGDTWHARVLPLVEPGLDKVAECGMPCFYALAESVALTRSEEKYAIVAVASEMAAAAGVRLDPPALREEVLVRYLLGRGVNVDAEVPVAKLGVELLVGARLMLSTTEPVPAALPPSADDSAAAVPPVTAAKQRTLVVRFYYGGGEHELRIYPDATPPFAELFPQGKGKPLRGDLKMEDVYGSLCCHATGFKNGPGCLEEVKTNWSQGQCSSVSVRDFERWGDRDVRFSATEEH